MKRKALGRGLSSLIPEVPTATHTPDAQPGPYVEIDLDRIDPNPSQPRQRFAEAGLEELAASIAHQGVVQPILVRRRDGRYQLVAGERRLRASQRAGLRKIPAVVREVADNKMLELSLVENIQRAELDPIEEARAYKRLIEELGVTQADVAERLGKDRSTVANSLRLLNLTDSIQSALRDGTLSPGHARALLSMPEEKGREALARKIVARGLSVREAERLASSKPGGAAKKAEPAADPNTQAAEERFMTALGTRVRIRRQGPGGTVEVSFHSEEELQRIFEQIVEA